MDVTRLVAYWQSGSAEDFAAARALLEKRHTRHALFLAHLALEKLLKAHVTRARNEIPPRIHDLLRLAEFAQLPLTANQRVFLGVFQKHCLAGRYPDLGPAPSVAEGEDGLRQAEEMLTWLTHRLPES